MAASEASQDTEGTLTICCERITSLERDVAELRRELRVLASRVDASSHPAVALQQPTGSFLSFLACCWSRQQSLDNYRS